MTSPYRIPPHNIDPTGADASKSSLRYNPATGKAEWRASEVSTIRAGIGITIDRTDPSAPVISATGATQQSNENPAGVLTISGATPTTETIITGMDLTGFEVGKEAAVSVNLWISMNQPSVTKGATARLRADSATGPILASHVFPDAGDSVLGHTSQWVYTGTYTPTTDRLLVTIQATTGSPTIYSDLRAFSVEQEYLLGLSELPDVDVSGGVTEGDVLAWDVATARWRPTGNERIVVLNAGQTTLPPGTPARSLVVRRVP